MSTSSTCINPESHCHARANEWYVRKSTTDPIPYRTVDPSLSLRDGRSFRSTERVLDDFGWVPRPEVRKRSYFVGLSLCWQEYLGPSSKHKGRVEVVGRVTDSLLYGKDRFGPKSKVGTTLNTRDRTLYVLPLSVRPPKLG